MRLYVFLKCQRQCFLYYYYYHYYYYCYHQFFFVIKIHGIPILLFASCGMLMFGSPSMLSTKPLPLPFPTPPPDKPRDPMPIKTLVAALVPQSVLMDVIFSLWALTGPQNRFCIIYAHENIFHRFSPLYLQEKY